MTAFQIWLLFVFLPNIAILALLGLMIGTVFFGVWLFTQMDEAADKFEVLGRRKLAIIGVGLLWSVAACIPSSEQIALIVGGSHATQIEGAENIPPNLAKAINKALEDYLEE